MHNNESREPNLDSIDFVITWVNSNDPEWQQDFEKHSDGRRAIGNFRNMGTLQYVFRGIESFAPWVRKIHLVTYGHSPPWLNLTHPKLHLVRHEDILPSDALPNFHSGAIELAFGNIKDLSEKFVYFNDDMFMIKATSKDRFFRRDLPKDFFQIRILFHNGRFSHSIHEQMSLIAGLFQTKDVFTWHMFPKVFNVRYGIIENLRTFLSLIVSKTLSCFVIYHHPQPHLKTNIEEASHTFADKIKKLQRKKFRDLDSISQYLFRFWGLINGRFYPYQPRDALYRTISSKSDIDEAIDRARRSDHRFVCFNDSADLTEAEYSYFTKRVGDFLDDKLPDPCSFEITKEE